MSLVDVCDLEHDFAAYMKRVDEGESFLITRNKKPIGEFGPIKPSQGPLRPIGLYEGLIVVPDDFDDPLPADMLGEDYSE